MKRQLVVLLLVLGISCAARAQEGVSGFKAEDRNVAGEFTATPSVSIASSEASTSGVFSPASTLSTTALPSVSLDADSLPAPAPNPRFIYGGRDDFRWQLGLGVDWLRFRSSVFNSSGIGVNTSVTYFTNEWFGVEGVVSTGFAPEILSHEHVKTLIYGAGPKIAWRERKWEPWVHAIVGGAHEQPQIAGASKNSFAVMAGGGADYRFNPRLSGRLEADYVHTSFFSESQNNFQLTAGVVFHF